MVSLEAEPIDIEKMAVSPLTLRKRMIEHIHGETHHAQHGKTGAIWMKMNSLVDPDIIDLLYDASRAGVQIDLVVRGDQPAAGPGRYVAHLQAARSEDRPELVTQRAARETAAAALSAADIAAARALLDRIPRHKLPEEEGRELAAVYGALSRAAERMERGGGA